MTIEQIQNATATLATLSSEQKESYKQNFMAELAKIDNLGELSKESLEKISGGMPDWQKILGLFLDWV